MPRALSPVRWLLLALTLLTVMPSSHAAAPDETPVVVVTPSEWPELAGGRELGLSGEVTVKVWAPPGESWSAAVDDDVLTLTLAKPVAEGLPTWRALGTVSLPAGRPVKFVSRLGAEAAAARPKGAPTPVPAFVALTRDPRADLSRWLDVARGRIDGVAPPADLRCTTVRTNQQGADWRPPTDPVVWRDRAQALREQLQVTLGLWPLPERAPLEPEVFGKVERDGYTIEKVVLRTLPGHTLSGNLYRPVGVRGRVPAILCPHGHWEDGRVNSEVQQRCIRWAKLGCVVFLYDMVGYNDTKAFGHEFLNARLDRWGFSLAGLQTWNSLRVVDFLTGLPDVDPARIGCTGESGGGTQTFLLTALDPRIAVAAPVVMVSEYFQGGCVCENCSGLRHGTDNVEIAALAAPRPMKLVGATGDWSVNTTTKVDPAIRKVYELTGHGDRLSADVFTAPHNYNKTSREAVYAFMARWLLGITDPEATREGEQTPEQPEDLWTFTSAHPAPADRKSPAELEAELVRQQSTALDRLSPGEDGARWQADRRFLATAHRVRVGLVNPAAAELTATAVRRADREGLAIHHGRVGRTVTGEAIPVVRLIPAKSTGRLTVVMHPAGKAGLVGPDGAPTPLVRALLDRGQEVVGFDPLLVGESADPAAPSDRRPDTRHATTYNKVLAADRVQDLATVLAWARSLDGIRQTNLIGTAGTGPLVLLARPLLIEVARTAVDLDGFDYGDGSADVPAGLDLPGVLQFGGLSGASALAAPAPLRIARPGGSFHRDRAERAYGHAGSLGQIQVEGSAFEPEALARWIADGE